jgi:hypothetical protein
MRHHETVLGAQRTPCPSPHGRPWRGMKAFYILRKFSILILCQEVYTKGNGGAGGPAFLTCGCTMSPSFFEGKERCVSLRQVTQRAGWESATNRRRICRMMASDNSGRTSKRKARVRKRNDHASRATEMHVFINGCIMKAPNTETLNALIVARHVDFNAGLISRTIF